MNRKKFVDYTERQMAEGKKGKKNFLNFTRLSLYLIQLKTAI